jgi:hypothetical protein
MTGERGRVLTIKRKYDFFDSKKTLLSFPGSSGRCVATPKDDGRGKGRAMV